MNFQFSNEQQSLQSEIARQVRSICPAENAMNVMNGDYQQRRLLYKQFANLGYTSIAFPEEYGGYGMGYLELCILAKELGRNVVPAPIFSSIYMAAEAILLYGSAGQKEKYLPKIASGELIATLAWSEKQINKGIASTACSYSGGVLNGVKIPVPDIDLADLIVVLAKSEFGELVWTLFDCTEAGMKSAPIRMVDDAWPHCEVQFTNASAELMPETSSEIDEVFYRSAIPLAFEQVGGAEQCLDMALEYALERKSFGHLIGSYQAIKHKLADIYASNELALSHAYYAGWALSSNNSEIRRAASGVRIAATRAYESASSENIHIHGGMGFTWESICHLYYKRSRMYALSLGSERQWNSRLIESLK